MYRVCARDIKVLEGLGAVLSQVISGIESMHACMSLRIHGAFIWHHARQYLYGRKFVSKLTVR